MMTENFELIPTFDPSEYSAEVVEAVDKYGCPVSQLTFDEIHQYRIRELLEYDEGNLKSKISIYADGKLRQAISIVSEHHPRLSEHKNRYLLFSHGRNIVLDGYGDIFQSIKNVYSEIIHSDNDDAAADVSGPGKCTLTQCLDAQKRPAIQLYVTPEHHSEISSIAGRIGFSMSDYAVVCIWSSILTSDAALPERLKEHGRNLLSEFRKRIDKRLRDLERIRSEIMETLKP